jgi:hypothetical protein
MTMKLSDNTMEILKNFSTINPSVMFKPGNTIRTISPQKTVMSSATVDEEFDSSAGVYDLSRFLATLTLLEQPDIEFQDTNFVIKSGRRGVKYTYAAESMIVTPPNKDIEVPNPEVQVRVTWEELNSVIKASNVLQLPEISFSCEGDEILMSAIDSKNPTADKYDVSVSDATSADTFSMIIKTENLKMIPADYEVSISSKGMAHFKSERVQYWVAVEANSKFG